MSEKIYITADKITTCGTECHSQETNINWFRDEKIIKIETSDNTFITKMKHIMERDPEHYKCYYYENNIDKKTGKIYSYVFETDKKLLTFRVNKAKKELSPEERKLLGERLAKGRK